MDFIKQSQPSFHQVAIASALTLSVLSPTTWADRCTIFPAEPLTVNITSESDDFCDEQVSLREAITYANEQLGKDTITFSDVLKGQTIALTLGRIDINESLNITGPDADELITLKAGSNGSLFYIKSYSDRIDFDLKNSIIEKEDGTEFIIEMSGYGGDIILDNIQTNDATHGYSLFKGYSKSSELLNDLSLTLKNSSISGSDFADEVLDIRSESNAGSTHITISDSQVTNTTAYNLAYSSSSSREKTSSILIQDSSITESTFIEIARTYSNEGVANIDLAESVISGNTLHRITDGFAYHGTANTRVTHSIISGNTIRDNGFTIGYADTLDIQDSMLCDNLDSNIEGNDSDQLGVNSIIENDYSSGLDISNSKICNNQQRGLKLRSPIDMVVTIENSVITNNNNEGDGAGIYASSYRQAKLNLNIINSSISGNKSQGHGGGISVEASDESEINLKINNSTISDNQAGYGLSGENESEGTGGGVKTYSDPDSAISVDITHSTISHNISSGLGGGINSFNTQINNSIIANNVAGDDADQDLVGSFTINNSLIEGLSTINLTSINGTFIQNIGNGEGQTPDTGNNILGQDPLLQELTLSGGTWVHQLSVNSPALAAGNAEADNLPEFDQRGKGFARVRNIDTAPELDMGAVQYFANPVAVNDAITVEQGSENNSVNVLENDAQNSEGLPLSEGSVTILVHPENGNAEVLTDGLISYTPNAEFFGTDSLMYVLQDIAGNTSAQASVTITVNEVATPEETIPDDRSSENAAPHKSGGGTVNYWLLSLLGLFGLRRKLK